MTQMVAKYAARKLMSKELEKYKSKDVAGPYDPYYELVPHPRKPGKTKKVKKQIPAYIPPTDAEILAHARKRAYMLDMCLFNFMGFRFGWSSVIGIVPAVGDGIDFLLASNLIRRMSKVECGLGKKTVSLMVMYMIMDLLVGLIPFVGDLADAAMKCNSRNVRLFEQRLDEVYKPKRLIEEDEKLPQNMRPRPATVYEDFSDEEEDRRNAFNDQSNVRTPQRAYSGRRDRQRDEEMGLPRHESYRSQREKPGRHNSRR